MAFVVEVPGGLGAGWLLIDFRNADEVEAPLPPPPPDVEDEDTAGVAAESVFLPMMVAATLRGCSTCSLDADADGTTFD